ncbi:MAG: NAD(P)-dependent oxidoreductase [Burkholderiaceae bacterium]|jgi:3-hydroxyisobutyrate dehydrogenase|nr:NAD(P)-dependent oxidoreductase [Burkholderiaceae bacterium]
MSTPSLPRLAVLGTGLIGAPVARNLQRHGFAVHAWNRTAGKARALAADGVAIAADAAEAVRGAAIIVTVLKDGPAVLQAMQAAAPGLQRGALWLQMGTVGVQAIATLAQFAQQHGLVFYDCPVQGTRQPAEQGQLVVLAAGPLEHRDQVQPVFDAIGRRSLWIAPQAGAASRLKLALNHWAFSLTHGLAESLALARGLDVDPALVVQAVAGGPMDSGFFQAKAAAMLSGDYGASFTVANAVKDARLVAEAAAGAGLWLEGAEAGLQRFERVLAAGHGDKDMAASHLAPHRAAGRPRQES